MWTAVVGGWLIAGNQALVGKASLINEAGFQRMAGERILRLTNEQRLAGAPLDASDPDVLDDAIRTVREAEPRLTVALQQLPTPLRPFYIDRLTQVTRRFLDAAASGDLQTLATTQRDFLTASSQLALALQHDAEARAAQLRMGFVVLVALQMGLVVALGVVVLRALGKASLTIEEELQERRLVRNMMEMIQSISSRAELKQTISVHLGNILPDLSGSVHMFAPSHDVVEQVAAWGTLPPDGDEIPLADCWGLRLGKSYGSGTGHHVRCQHVPGDVAGHWCFPMLAEGNAVGMLHVRTNDRVVSDAQREGASRLAEGLAITLANLRLCETLQNQSIRDPLTGVFNRRYMEESVTRELRRAARRDRPVSIMLVDLDHFKALNDSFGHGVGDELLCAFGRFLSTRCRAEDIVCRYGGEEFVLIFPEMSAADVVKKAEILRMEWSGHTVSNGAGGRTSASFSGGTATYPADAVTPDALISAADVALYAAKSGGRDCIVSIGQQRGSADTASAKLPKAS